MKRTVDITKRKNRYCDHCANCRKCDLFCKVKGTTVNYWNCCKSFEWREEILTAYNLAEAGKQYTEAVSTVAKEMTWGRGGAYEL